MCDIIKTTRARLYSKEERDYSYFVMSVILRARDKNEREVSQVGECPICALCARFFLERVSRYMKEREDAFEGVRLQLERAWPKRIIPSPSSSANEKSSSGNTTNAGELETTPLRAMETNMEMVLKTLTTSSLFFEEEEKKKKKTTTTTCGGLRDDAKTLEKLLEEMKRHNEEDVEIAASTGARLLEEGNIEEDEEEAKCRIKKFLLGTRTRGVPKRGVAVKMVSSSSEEEKTLMSKGDVRVHVVDRSTAGSCENKETDDDAWMEDAIELIERAKKSNARAFVVVENCETEEKAREIASEMYSGAMAFSANRKEEDEFVFCLEGQMYLETDETRAMTGVTERRDNTKGSGLFALGSESDSNDDDNNDAEKRDTSNINNKEDKATTTTTAAAAAAAIGLAQNVNDIATCARAQTNIANAIREVCLERAERYALEYQPIRDRIYVKLKEKAKAKNAAKKQKENKGFDVSNDEPVRMSANASSPLVKNDQIKNNNDMMAKKEGGGVMSFLEWIGDEEVDLPANEQKGISYQSKADAARIKSLEAALRELQPDHPLLMFCPPPPPPPPKT